MPEGGLVRFSVEVPWGLLLLMRPTPLDGDIWGTLAPLRGTPWGDLIPVVPGSALTHALRGHTMPLERSLGIAPKERARRISDEVGMCQLWHDKSCTLRKPWCRPGPKLPFCYEPPGDNTETVILAATVAQAWKEGRHVVVPDESEFSL